MPARKGSHWSRKTRKLMVRLSPDLDSKLRDLARRMTNQRVGRVTPQDLTRYEIEQLVIRGRPSEPVPDTTTGESN